MSRRGEGWVGSFGDVYYMESLLETRDKRCRQRGLGIYFEDITDRISC